MRPRPPNASTGAVNIAAYFPNGWLAIAPDAFSYGPHVLQILPNAGTPAGGDIIQIYGYGFGSDPTKLTVKIGGAQPPLCNRSKTWSPSGRLLVWTRLILFPSNASPCKRRQEQRGSPTSPSSPAGSVTSPKAFQYLQNENFYARSAIDKFVLYDQPRQLLYRSDIDHIEVFNLAGSFFQQPI